MKLEWLAKRKVKVGLANGKTIIRDLPKGIYIDDGTVSVRIFPNGKPFKRKFGRADAPGAIDDAIAKLHEWRQQIRIGKFELEEHVKRITIEQACELFWNKEACNKPSATSCYKVALDLFKKIFKGRFIDTFTKEDTKTLRAFITNNGRKASTANRYHMVWTSMFYCLKEWKRDKAIAQIKLPDENPGSLVQKVDEKVFARKRVLTPDEFNIVMKHATIRGRRIILTAINTLLRRKDLRLLKKSDNVSASDHTLRGTQAKTGKPYEVPITTEVEKVLKTAIGDKPLDFTNFRREFDEMRAAAKKAGVDHFEFRDLRRSGARMMLASGYDIATVQGYLGHTTLNMTQVYVAAGREDKRLAGEVLGAKFKDNFTDPKIDPPAQKEVAKEKAKTHDYQGVFANN